MLNIKLTKTSDILKLRTTFQPRFNNLILSVLMILFLFYSYLNISGYAFISKVHRMESMRVVSKVEIRVLTMVLGQRAGRAERLQGGAEAQRPAHCTPTALVRTTIPSTICL